MMIETEAAARMWERGERIKSEPLRISVAADLDEWLRRGGPKMRVWEECIPALFAPDWWGSLEEEDQARLRFELAFGLRHGDGAAVIEVLGNICPDVLPKLYHVKFGKFDDQHTMDGKGQLADWILQDAPGLLLPIHRMAATLQLDPGAVMLDGRPTPAAMQLSQAVLNGWCFDAHVAWEKLDPLSARGVGMPTVDAMHALCKGHSPTEFARIATALAAAFAETEGPGGR